MELLTLVLVAGTGAGLAFGLVIYFLSNSSKKIKAPQPTRNASMDDADIVIVGAGILGTTLAISMARNGRQVAVIERNMGEVQTIAGEVLMPGGRKALHKLGLAGVIAEIEGAVAHTNLYSVLVDENIEWKFTFPQPVIGFHHEKFLTALRERAKQEKNVKFIGGTVTELLDKDDGPVNGVQYRSAETNEVKEIHAALTVVADGRYSKFRKALTRESPVSDHVVVGMIFDGPIADEDRKNIKLYSFKNLPYYMSLYSISDTEYRGMAWIPDGAIKNVQEFLVNEIVPRMPERLQEPLRLGILKNGLRTCRANYLPSQRVVVPGLLLLGDALGMRHPVSASGMTICFQDVVRWTELLSEVPDLYDYEKMMLACDSFFTQRKPSVLTMSCLTEIMNNVFSSTDGFGKMSMLNYFKLGGKCSEEPGLMFSAYITSPVTLIKHLAASTLYSSYKTLIKKPLWNPTGVFDAVNVLINGTKGILKYVLQEIKV